MSEEKKKQTGNARTSAESESSKNASGTSRGQKKTQNGADASREEAKKTQRTGKRGQAEESSAESNGSEKKEPNPSSVGNQLATVLLIVLAVFIGICYAFRDEVGVLGLAIDKGLFGLFGLAAFLVPFLLLQMALFWRRDVLSGAVKFKYLVAIFVTVMAAVLVHTIYCMASDVPKLSFATAFTWDNIKGFAVDGASSKGGGLFGGFLACAFICAVGYPGTIFFGVLFLVGFVLALFGLTPLECVQRFRFYRRRAASLKKQRAEQQKEAKEARKEAEKEAEKHAFAEKTPAKTAQKASPRAKKAPAEEDAHANKIDRDIFMDDAAFGVSEEPASERETIKPVRKKPAESIEKTEENESGARSLNRIFDTQKDGALLSRYAAPETEDADYKAELIFEKNGASYAPLTDETAHGGEKSESLPAKKETLSEKKTEKAAPIVIASEKPAKEEAAKAPAAKKAEKSAPANDVISIRPPEMSVPAPATEAEDEEAEIAKPREYEFPPIDLLSEPPKDKADGDVSAELRENADRIIQTLDSFNVRVNISNVSRGPTITRYEVEPAPGTRVRSIINLLDDIALSLATSGVRSDGIISGKSAIGIEVPNKKTNMVYVRELIEDSRFEAAKSKLTTSLGMDVSGAPVYLDIVKMPHLLIAGATGQGKSVCINSLIISLLYKARPDEVKLILIDPKKVELNVYNGLPHLLVPVVFDPKKAAGSLHWAVQEMERRFELIEAMHVRNIAQYNNAIAEEPQKEKLPHVVIIIDELADLMMSAPDDVETSICRLAQKARAAGMHLIIGTQRPSTDVITGLIKANIPSRIAFTVSNQIDSRIILDTQGAEKLIGKGDMLYLPVGSSKPIRVQGSYVSESEIESIIDFIKAQSTEVAYSDEVIKEIEKNAAVCGQKKGKAAASADAELSDGEDADPMLDAAIELAVESGKISTSLIQRRLSLGYGRAAKLIDVMEKRGIVSPPEGQKPRTVLITREEYLEMRMNHIDTEETDDDVPFDL